MRNLLRGIAALLAGFITASILMMAVETLNGRVLYPGLAKAAEGVQDREALRLILAQAPLGALGVVIAGWFLGSGAGAWLASRISPAGSTAAVWGLGILLVLGGIANNLMVPPPLWFWAAGLLALMAGTYGGARLGLPSTPSPRTTR